MIIAFPLLIKSIKKEISHQLVRIYYNVDRVFHFDWLKCCQCFRTNTHLLVTTIYHSLIEICWKWPPEIVWGNLTRRFVWDRKVYRQEKRGMSPDPDYYSNFGSFWAQVTNFLGKVWLDFWSIYICYHLLFSK